ncbi:hypothetical protein H112_00321 [Trichophyton rubrum D6]|uniref:MYND-type domain-containing protein n=2 Tax=Trichophyton TaxID=5550 RepID=A0A022WGY7_TRIRU|nr:hypothetical protein H100_00322 [Trichophyton rubrum MR850]EZF46742.1 hypothetical protein H102_00321 [Trichophyton rubrum CBS 100081]EZF57396.1 hypothetical protein H103_00320 [Trichophyton rubrum CBS 288.86]EZF67970.1 hypothetical protein H104_00320 [Trichophyton rubrum CBS 289.86]EZF78593.1 hypothetical protein H105_00316 [Trichophyton soudanense CBS 452.61]EZF89218.1 hypothetical protein H110_00324 [Trichophyton rubrum MR1448]EZG00120.1 hypothetical protein H113_00323 [Trichophyton rub
MAPPTLAVHSRELIGTDAAWKEDYSRPSDAERLLFTNSALALNRDGADVSLCLLPSPGNCHLAVVEAVPSARIITVTIFRLCEQFPQVWTSKTSLDVTTSPSASFYASDKTKVSGAITEDGTHVFILCKPPTGGVLAWTVTSEHGWVRRKPPSNTDSLYSLNEGVQSDDGEHMFYKSRKYHRFSQKRQVEQIEVYDIRTLQVSSRFVVRFGNARFSRDLHFLRPLRADRAVHCAISTAGSRENRTSPPLVFSSDNKVHFNCDGIEGALRLRGIVTVSPDGCHMVFVHFEDGLISHWDLTAPTLKPLGTAQLPGVGVATLRQWVINGQLTDVRDSIPKQVHHCRFSPSSKVVTVITATAGYVVVNVFLTLNLQLIYHYQAENVHWPGYVTLQIGCSNETGLTVFGASPTTEHPDTGEVLGVLGAVIPLPAIYDKIKQIEEYFDTTSSSISKVIKGPVSSEKTPFVKFAFMPDRGFVRETGLSPQMSADDRLRQDFLYEFSFRSSNSTTNMPSTTELREKYVPLLASLTPFSWDSTKTVSLFGVVMKYKYYIIAIGNWAQREITRYRSTPGIVRVLYVSETILSSDTGSEKIAVYREGPHYILSVTSSKDTSFGRSFSGAPLPLPRHTVITPHFLEEDAWYDAFIIKEAEHGTLPSGWMTTPNPLLIASTSFGAYLPPVVVSAGGDALDYGHRNRSHYVVAKHAMWHSYGLRGLRNGDSTNEIFFGGGRYMDALGSYFSMIYDDRSYNSMNPLFPSTFSAACNMDWRSQNTKHVDAFFRRLHQSSQDKLLFNAQSVACTLPLACHVRPFGTLSFMRHVVLLPFRVVDIGAVDVTVSTTPIGNTKSGLEHEQTRIFLDDLQWFLRRFFGGFISSLSLISSTGEYLEANSSVVTLPLPGFSSFNHRLFKPPPVSNSDTDPYWEFIRATYPDPNIAAWESAILRYVEQSGNGPTSPFTRLVEEILYLKDREIQFLFLRVIWLDKLLRWKMRTFGRSVYLTRVAGPMLILFAIHLVVSILLTGRTSHIDITFHDGADGHSYFSVTSITTSIKALASIEAFFAAYILLIKARQAYRVPRLFRRSIFNYIDLAAIILGLTTFGLVVSNRSPPRAFLAFSTLLLWIAALLMLRVYEATGTLLLLLTEMLHGVLPFLILLALIVLGFTFVPFLLLRNIDSTGIDQTPFSDFGLSMAEIIKFMASDYDALKVWERSSAAARTLRSLYIIVVTILLLNTLIALLNLKVKSADEQSRLLWLRQMASLQCEIELGLLWRQERRRRDWFPEWFTYTMSEGEKRDWTAHVEQSPLRWTKENDFGEDKDHGPGALQEPRAQTPTNGKSSVAGKPDVDVDTLEEEAGSQEQQKETSDEEFSPPSEPLLYINGEPAKFTDTATTTKEKPENKDVSDEGEASDQAASQQQRQDTTGPSSSESDPKPQPKPEPQTGPEKKCVVCSAPGKLCLGCKKVAYCGTEHQRHDWANHKTTCKGKQKA